jgi:diaminopimelate epimerase
MKFTKMHGLGNDYVYVDCFAQRLEGVDLAALARHISDRRRGVGADGLILIRPDERADVRMEMYNADGSRAEMCGNGIRCVAKYALGHGLTKNNPLRIATDAGMRFAEVISDDGRCARVTVVMGEPRFEPESLPARLAGEQIADHPLQINGRELRVSCVSVGNPHAVVFVSDFSAIDVERDGGAIETHDMFPQRINVHFVRRDGPSAVTMRTWERGSGATQACGTGACAAAVLCGEPFPVTVHLPGGDLEIDLQDVSGDVERGRGDTYDRLLTLVLQHGLEQGEVDEALLKSSGTRPASGLRTRATDAAGASRKIILMTGPAEEVFEGTFDHRGCDSAGE